MGASRIGSLLGVLAESYELRPKESCQSGQSGDEFLTHECWRPVGCPRLGVSGELVPGTIAQERGVG